MKNRNLHLVFFFSLLKLLTIRSMERRFEKREIRDCVAHNLAEISAPLHFSMDNGSTSLIVRVSNLLKVDISVTSPSGFNNLALQRCNYDSFCADCSGHIPLPFLLESTFQLSFFEHSAIYRSLQNQTVICSNLFTKFSEELSIDFRLVNPVEYSFKGLFAFNCKEEICWMFPELSIQFMPKASEKKVFYFKSNKENETAYMKGLEDIALVPTRWWKRLALIIEEEKPAGNKILSVREEQQLVLVRHLGVLTPHLKMWTESSPGVFWTEECLPQKSSEKAEKSPEKSQEEIGESFFGTGLSKETFLHIVLFGGGLLATSTFAILCTLCVTKCIRKDQHQLRHLEAPSADKEKSKSVSSDAIDVDSGKEYERQDVRYSALKSPSTGRVAMPKTVSVPVPETMGTSPEDFDDEVNGYMEMRPFAHILQKKEAKNTDRMSCIYESLGSLIEEENKHIYDTLNDLNCEEASNKRSLYQKGNEYANI